MKSFGFNAPAVPRRSMVRWIAVIGSMSVAIAIGLLTVKSFSSTANRLPAAIYAGRTQPATALPSTTSEIVPSPDIETNPQFFFGTGDGSNGYYAEHPRP